MNRKSFIQHGMIGAGGLLATPLLFSQNNTNKNTDPLPAEKVKEFVVAGHNNGDKVKSLLLEFPTILYATWDWGNGDFETALEGAGHVGNKEVAEYLISIGARTNIFVLSMLGKTELVKSWIETYPGLLEARGPHGFTLLHHAQKGGSEAAELVAYFQNKGLRETRLPL